MSKQIKIDGQLYNVVVRNGKPHFRLAMATVTAPTPAPTAKGSMVISPELYDQLVDDLGQSWVDDKGYVKRIKPLFRRKSVPTARADADGGKCPHFGVPQHWIKIGQDSENEDVKAGRCGFRRDGKYAKKAGFDNHMANIVAARLVKSK